MIQLVNIYRIWICLLSGTMLIGSVELVAQERATPTLEQLKLLQFPGQRASAIGVTRSGTAISSMLCADDLDLNTAKTRVLIVAGLDGNRESSDSAVKIVNWFNSDSSGAELKSRFALSIVPAVLSDRILKSGASEGTNSAKLETAFPPDRGFYDAPQNAEAAYLWRWIGMHAPDFVLEVRSGPALKWIAPKSTLANNPLILALGGARASEPENSLCAALIRTAPSEVGVVPAIAAEFTSGQAIESMQKLLQALMQTQSAKASAARLELQRRSLRTPNEIASDLSKYYGQALNQVAYIPALALVGRVRLAELTGDESHVKAVERIVEPYVSGAKPTDISNGSALPGHLIFCELADRSTGPQRQRYVELARRAADLGLDENRRPRASMPFHLEMSDAFFMGGPILARVGQLTGDEAYFEACANHIAFMNRLVLRRDGIYRHSPLDETAWGRGNGFPALGLALCLSAFPESHPRRDEILKSFQAHLTSLLAHQDYTGCWRQVIDHEESYREFTATCMITFALARGIRRGWLPREKFQPAVERGWHAVKTRIGSDGHLVDVCTGTGKQTSLRAYYDRPAILGVDDRGGAMGLMVATEMALFESGK